MGATRTKIADSVASHTLDKGVSKDYSRQLAAYLLAEGRTDELDSLLRDIQSAWVNSGFVEVIARSAHPLDSAAKNYIENRVKALYPSAKAAKITELHEASVIGGVRLTIADQRLDLTVQSKLNKFKQLTTAGKDN